MIKSMFLPVLALSFGIGRRTWPAKSAPRLAEALTSEYMLLARAKGLTKSEGHAQHAMKKLHGSRAAYDNIPLISHTRRFHDYRAGIFAVNG
jgi:hypothetical protein